MPHAESPMRARQLSEPWALSQRVSSPGSQPPHDKTLSASHSLEETELSRAVKQAIQISQFPIQLVSARCERDHVTVFGTVTSWFLKQVVQEAVRRVPGVNRITSEIRVVADTNETADSDGT